MDGVDGMRDGCERVGEGSLLSRTMTPAHGPGVHSRMPMLDYGRTHHTQEAGKRGGRCNFEEMDSGI